MGLVREAVKAWLADSSSSGNRHLHADPQPCGCGEHRQEPHSRSWDNILPKRPSPITNDMPPCDHSKIKFAIREFRTEISREFVILVFQPHSDVVYGAFIDKDYETARHEAELFIGEQDLMGVLDGSVHRHNNND